MTVEGKASRTGTRRGQATVEMALVLPIILLIMVGMIEFARAWNLHQALTDAVREGARRALVADASMPVDSVYAPMWRYLQQAGYNPSYATMGVCDTPVTSCGSTITGSAPAPGANWKKTGSNITVSVSLPYRFFVLRNRSIVMKSTLTVRNE
jgi:Flp pilus assembly protein TadG